MASITPVFRLFFCPFLACLKGLRRLLGFYDPKLGNYVYSETSVSFFFVFKHIHNKTVGNSDLGWPDWRMNFGTSRNILPRNPFDILLTYPDMSTAPVILAASAKHTATIIFLHGLGDTGHGWASAIAAIKPPFAKVICPTAPTMPVTLNSGFKMTSWFDLKSLDASGEEDEAGIKKAAENVHLMIDEEEKAGINTSRIVIGGFSQGGALALYSAFTCKKPLGGVMALSCWLPLHKQFPASVVGNKSMPILQAHGDCDPLVPYKWGQMTASLLKQLNSNVEFKTYRGLGHSSNDEEMADLKAFVSKVLGE